MPMALADLENQCAKAWGVTIPDDIATTQIDTYLNRSYWEVMDKFPFREKERAGQFPTTAGIRNYEIPTPVEAVYEVAVVDPVTLQHIPLDQMKANETEKLYNEQSFKQHRPRKYLLENCYIRFWPTPDQVYTIVLRKKTILQDIQTSGIEIPQVWNDIVLYGGIWRGAYEEYRDFGVGDKFKALQRELMSTTTPREIKEINQDFNHAGVFPAYSRDF
jgi:hypothetical protein